MRWLCSFIYFRYYMTGKLSPTLMKGIHEAAPLFVTTKQCARNFCILYSTSCATAFFGQVWRPAGHLRGMRRECIIHKKYTDIYDIGRSWLIITIIALKNEDIVQIDDFRIPHASKVWKSPIIHGLPYQVVENRISLLYIIRRQPHDIMKAPQSSDRAGNIAARRKTAAAEIRNCDARPRFQRNALLPRNR